MCLDIEAVKKFYRVQKKVWPENNKYYAHSKKEICRFINDNKFNNCDVILNLGSGGNTYGLKNTMHHVDIVDTNISEFPLYTIANIENLPFSNSEFTNIICVGSVLNYSSAMEAISEISRVARTGCELIIEFECSRGFEYLAKPYFCQDATIANLTYCNESHVEWLYSENYIKKILKENYFSVNKIHRFHYVSSFLCGFIKNENLSGRAAKVDVIVRHIPFLKKFAGNIVFFCKKN